MVISKTAEYALRAVVHLARQANRVCPRREISQATEVPVEYLSKILQRLAQEGVLQVRLGAGGGYWLDRPPDALSVLDVVAAVDPIERIETCPLGLDAHAGALCPLHEQLLQATNLVEQAFRSTTIAQLMTEPSRGRKSDRCSFPSPPQSRRRSRRSNRGKR